MIISDGRINYLSRYVGDSLLKNQFISCGETSVVYREIKRVFNLFVQKEEEINTRVKSKIASLKRNVPEGSGEWEILYRQYYNEEIEKM